jgi:hypothetical protein
VTEGIVPTHGATEAAPSQPEIAETVTPSPGPVESPTATGALTEPPAAASPGASGSLVVINEGAHVSWQYANESFRGYSSPVVNQMSSFLPLVLRK